MTTGSFLHIDTASYTGKPWSKVDCPETSFKQLPHTRPVTNLRGIEQEFDVDKSGFAVYHYPAQEKAFTDDSKVRNDYYAEVQQLLGDRLEKQNGGRKIKKIVIFDHTIRRRDPSAPRQPVFQVHVDQTPGAAEARVRRHLPPSEAEELLNHRYQIINVWRPIGHPASDHPLGVIDWRTTQPEDFVPVDLLYPKRDSFDVDDDRGKERLPDPALTGSTEGYEARGETLAVAPSERQKFYYVKDMTPDEVMLLKCFDSEGEGMSQGKPGVAVRTPHTAFEDPNTPKDAPGRQSIEVRCLVFWE
jgi:hypothetical protein